MYEILAALMREFNVKPYEISKATEISSSSFSDWKHGRYNPKRDKIEKIADFFGISPEAFYSDISELPKYLAERVPRKKPVYDSAAGEGRINGEYTDEYITDDSSDEYSFCSIHGDSMYPVLHDGDIVKVRHQTIVSEKDIAIVKVDGETATAKYVEITNNGVWLRAENKAVYEDHYFTIREAMSLPIQIIGVVVELRRSLI